MRDRAREKRLRRLADRCDYQLIRSWAPWRPDRGTYALIDPVKNILILADPESGFGMGLDDIELFLEQVFEARRTRGS